MFIKILTSVIILAITSFGNLAAGQTQLKTRNDSIAYAIGMNVGKNIIENIKKDSLDFNLDILIEGFADLVKSRPAILTQDNSIAVIQEFSKEMMEKQEKIKNEKAAANKAKGDEFLAENKKDKNVIVTPSGLQYKVIKYGEGKKPLKTDSVKVHYKGTLLDGTTFDSSIDRGEPAVFLITRVIPGWTEALQLMSEGSKYQLFIPSDLAYKDRGAPPNIGPNETLIFEVELLEVISPKAGQPEAKPAVKPEAKSKKKSHQNVDCHSCHQSQCRANKNLTGHQWNSLTGNCFRRKNTGCIQNYTPLHYD